KLDDYVRALIGNPDVVLRIDLDCMCVGPCIKVVSNLTQESAISTELQQLRGTCSVGGTSSVATSEHKDVTFGIHSDARNFAKIQVVWKMQEIGYGAVVDFKNRSLLRTDRTDRKKQDKNGPFHSGYSDNMHSLHCEGIIRQSSVRLLQKAI